MLFLGYSKTQKGYRCYDFVLHRLRVSQNVVFWEHCSFVKLSHFRSSLTTSSILEIFLDELHFPYKCSQSSFVLLYPISRYFLCSPKSPSNDQVEDEQVDDELPHFEPRSLTPTLLKDLPQDTPPHHSTRVRSILAHLLDYHCYTTLSILHEPYTYRETSIDSL